MTSTFPRRWLRLQTRELDAEIRKLGLPFAAADALRDAVRAEKTRLKSERARIRVRLARWADLIRQVKYEAHKVGLRSDHIRLRPDACAPSRLEALEFYANILRECLRRMEAQRNLPDLPLPKSTDYRDFIPEGVKAQVRLRFDAIPRGDGRRVAEPFGDGKPRKPPRDVTSPEALLFKQAAPSPTPDPKFLFQTRPTKAGNPTDGHAVRQFNPGEEGEKQ